MMLSIVVRTRHEIVDPSKSKRSSPRLNVIAAERHSSPVGLRLRQPYPPSTSTSTTDIEKLTNCCPLLMNVHNSDAMFGFDINGKRRQIESRRKARLLVLESLSDFHFPKYQSS